MITAVATGYAQNGSGFSPTFDVLVDGRKMGELTGGHPYSTPGAASEASVRVVEYVKANDKFPNLCEHF
jgi:hypothetical protein